jgi:hypothetical protein
LFLESLQRAFEAGKLRFFGSLEPLQERPGFTRLLTRAKSSEWVVYAKRPFAGPERVLDYVGRYTHRVALSNSRLLDIENNQIRFQWKDYRHDHQVKAMTLAADEFIRRFLLHVLPSGLRRIRYYGFLGNRYRQQKLAQCRRLLGMQMAEQGTPSSQPEADYRDRYEELTGCSLRLCPQCRQGRMVLVQILPRSSSRSPLAIDSS